MVRMAEKGLEYMYHLQHGATMTMADPLDPHVCRCNGARG